MGAREQDVGAAWPLARRCRHASDRLRAWLARCTVGAWTGDASALAVVTGLLLLVGLVMSLSASFVDAAATGDPFEVFRRQLLWAMAGVPLFLLVARTHPRLWRPASWILLLVSLVMLVAVLVPGIGLAQFGSRSWIAVGPFSGQPGELAKLATLLWLADVLERKRPRPGTLHAVEHLLVPAVPLLLCQALLLMLQPDLGMTLVLALIVGLVLFVEGLPLRYVGAIGGTGVAAAVVLAVAAPYRLARITGWLDPEADPLGKGYQLLQSLYALGSGGWLGLGLGSSRGKWNFIPTPETDFIFAIVGEELGLVGALFVVSLFGAVLVLGLRVARTAADGFMRTVAFAITGWLVGQAFINIGAVIGLLPITGVTLPLISVGGSSMLVTLTSLGVLVAIARTTTPTTGRRRAGRARQGRTGTR